MGDRGLVPLNFVRIWPGDFNQLRKDYRVIPRFGDTDFDFMEGFSVFTRMGQFAFDHVVAPNISMNKIPRGDCLYSSTDFIPM